MKKDENIFNKCGDRRPFNTPDGYFDTLPEQIIDNLPESVPVTEPALQSNIWTKIKPWLYMAVSFIGIMFSIKIAMAVAERLRGSNKETNVSVVYSDEYIDSFMETVMIDDYTFYCLFTNSLD